MRLLVLTLGEEHYQAWGKLLHSLETGTPTFEAVYNSQRLEYFERHPSAAIAGDLFEPVTRGVEADIPKLCWTTGTIIPPFAS
jgi:hypothetical protein